VVIKIVNFKLKVETSKYLRYFTPVFPFRNHLILKNILSLFFCIFSTNVAYSEVASLVSIAAVDETDGNLKPALGVKMLVGSHNFSIWGWGRNFGPVEERSLLVSWGKVWTPFTTKIVSAMAGLSGLSETTRLKFKDYPQDNQDDTFYNGGIFFGLRCAYNFGPVIVDSTWESTLLPAGVTGGILLAMGRKQILSLGVGAMF
jgi:hypothetical protein